MKKIKTLNEILIVSFILISLITFVAFEPELISADTDDVVATLTVTSGISITDGSDITMSGIDMDTSTSTGQTSWTVKTSNEAGWKLELEAEQSNALACADTGEHFDDYSESASGTPESWMSDDGKFEFGFGVHATATDIFTSNQWGSGDNCGTGSTMDTNQYYLGFDSTNKIQVASKSATTTPSGQEIIFCVAAVQSGVYAPSGTYTATTTATATAL